VWPILVGVQGGTSIHRWVSQKAASRCSQITPTSTRSMGPDIGTLFVRHVFFVCRPGSVLLGEGCVCVRPFRVMPMTDHEAVVLQVPMVLPLAKMAVSGFTWCTRAQQAGPACALACLPCCLAAFAHLGSSRLICTHLAILICIATYPGGRPRRGE
jgi:hypothetical protein